MMASQRRRSESLLIHQHCGLYTDSATFRLATIIAHHAKRFVYATDFQDYFENLVDSWRKAVPLCPCAGCVNQRGRTVETISGEVPGNDSAPDDDETTTTTKGATGS